MGLQQELQEFPGIAGLVAVRQAIQAPLAILAFAATIRPATLGPVTTPGLGLIVAGPLAVILAGFRQRERIDLDEPSGEAP